MKRQLKPAGQAEAAGVQVRRQTPGAEVPAQRCPGAHSAVA